MIFVMRFYFKRNAHYNHVKYNTNMKILFISNQARSTSIFWSTLMHSMINAGHEVICCVPDLLTNEHVQTLNKQNIRTISYFLKAKSINPLHDIKSFFALCFILRKEQPDIIFTSTIKPIIYGNLATKITCKSKIYSCITGLGFTFEPSANIFKKLLHILCVSLYKISLSNIQGIIFQNTDDLATFKQKKIITQQSNTLITQGTGVDIEHFALKKNYPQSITFLLVARLLEAKGISDYVQAAQIIKTKYPHIVFQLLGPYEQGYGAISHSQIQHWHAQGYISYLGETNDVRPFMTNASVVVLPSWREGLSSTLMEAMSMGRPIIASNVPGCRELVHEGHNGILFKAKDASALAKALEHFILNPNIIPTFGANGRLLAEQQFDARQVAKNIMGFMKVL